MRQQDVGHTDVVIEYLCLGEARSRIQNLIEIGNGNSGAIDIQRSRLPHRLIMSVVSMARPLSLARASSAPVRLPLVAECGSDSRLRSLHRSRAPGSRRARVGTGR